MVAPSKAPRPVIEQVVMVVQLCSKLGTLREKRERMVSPGLIPMALRLKEFYVYMAAEMDKLGRRARASGAKPD